MVSSIKYVGVREFYFQTDTNAKNKLDIILVINR